MKENSAFIGLHFCLAHDMSWLKMHKNACFDSSCNLLVLGVHGNKIYLTKQIGLGNKSS